MSGLTMLFGLMALLALGSALSVILSRSPVYSVLSLVVNFFATAVLFLTLGAEFLAAVQVLVYAGAILVLFLFVVMLLNLRRVEKWRSSPISILGYFLAVCVGFELFWQITRHIGAGHPDPDPAPIGSVEVIGQLLYTKYLFLFEATSILLFVAVIGAVVLAKQVAVVREPNESRAAAARRILAGATPVAPRPASGASGGASGGASSGASGDAPVPPGGHAS